MQSADSIMISAREIATTVIANTMNYAPTLLAALIVLLLGWLLARLARGVVRRILTGLNRFLESVFKEGSLAGARLSTGVIAILAEASFGVVLFLAVTVAARIARLPAISNWLNQIVGFLPNILVGVVIIVLGYLVGAVANDYVSTSAKAANAAQGALLGRLVQGAVVITAAIIGLAQMGVDVTFLVALFAVAIGAVFIGFSIAFGLGARDYVSNLIGARVARQRLEVGLLVRIGDVEGEILEVTPTQIALDTADGRALVPARLAEERGVIILSRDASPGSGDG